MKCSQLFLEKIGQNPKFWTHFSQYFPKNDNFDSLIVGGYDDAKDGRESYKHTQALLRLMRCIMDWSDINNVNINMMNAKSQSISPKEFDLPKNFGNISNDSLREKLSGVVELAGKTDPTAFPNKDEVAKNIDFSLREQTQNRNINALDDLHVKSASVARTEDRSQNYEINYRRNSPDRLGANRQRNNRSLGISEDLTNRHYNHGRSVSQEKHEVKKTNYKRREKIQEVMNNIESLEKRLKYTYEGAAKGYVPGHMVESASKGYVPGHMVENLVVNPKYYDKPKSTANLKMYESMPDVLQNCITSETRFENRKASYDGSVS